MSLRLPTLFLAAAGVAGAVLPACSQTSASQSPLTFSASVRSRYEIWNWFPTDKANGAYSFSDTMVRLKADYHTKSFLAVAELAAPFLTDIPGSVSLAAPTGGLGQGANYHDASGLQSASAFMKQLYVQVPLADKTPSFVRLGRFEFTDGAEAAQTPAQLAWVKANRINQRLIGPFGFTAIGRSFDGMQVGRNSPHGNLTLMAAMPTRGVFSVNGWDTLSGIHIGYLAQTRTGESKNVAHEERLFAIGYNDSRAGVLKVDNRTAAARAADTSDINIGTFGGDSIRSIKIGSYHVDTLLWGALQAGQWGVQDHGAYAYAAEIGIKPDSTPWKPWLRAGYSVASGDGAAGNTTHGTFMPLLNTPRTYARYPFFTTANLRDGFVQVIANPTKKVTLRSDVHTLRLDKASDLWYVGGGAYNNAAFGYTGRPSNGKTSLGTLFDLSVDYQLDKNTAFTIYGAAVTGGQVQSQIYKSGDSTYVYFEVNRKF